MNEEILLVDKPAGMSSFGVVARVRRKLSEAAGMVEVKGKDGVRRQKRKKVKVGHTGTLDPFATGLLVILTGKGTKRANEFLKLDKEYIATIELGKVSTTGDIEGVILPFSVEVDLSKSNPPTEGCDFDPVQPEESSSMTSKGKITPSVFMSKSSQEVEPQASKETNGVCYAAKGANSSFGYAEGAAPSLSEIERVVRGFIGEIEQRVPAYSAVKINGQRAYKLAREGKNIEMPLRKVKIYKIEILEYEWPFLTIKCKVSSGTYIRTLGEDIGKALGVGGYLTALRRTKVGKWRIEEAKTLGELGVED